MAGLTLGGPDVPAWAPEEREGRSQDGPKGLQLEVGARRAPRLLVCYIFEKQGVKGYIGLDSRSS